MKNLFFVLMITTLNSSIASAALMDLIPYNHNGCNGCITHDQRTNLQWLDLNITRNLTLDEQLRLSGSGDNKFRKATRFEIDSLLKTAFSEGRDFITALSLAELLEAHFESYYYPHLQDPAWRLTANGRTAETYSSYPNQRTTFALEVSYDPLTDYKNFSTTYLAPHQNNYHDDQRYNNLSVWFVRGTALPGTIVSEPPIAILMLSSLMGLLYVGGRSKRV